MSTPESHLMLPDDEHNRKLVDNVHPSNWENPEPTVATTWWSLARERQVW